VSNRVAYRAYDHQRESEERQTANARHVLEVSKADIQVSSLGLSQNRAQIGKGVRSCWFKTTNNSVAGIPGQERQRRWEVKELRSMIGSTFLYSFQYIISYKLRLLIGCGTLEEAPERWLTLMQTLKLRFCYSPL
jgi:hypothetical protein